MVGTGRFGRLLLCQCDSTKTNSLPDFAISLSILAVSLLRDREDFSPRTRFNEIPFYKIGGQLRFSKKEIEKWLIGYKVPSVTATLMSSARV